MQDLLQEHFINIIQRKKCYLMHWWIHIYEIYDEILTDFEKLSASEQTSNMSACTTDGMDQMIDYVYDHYDHFRLLLKCGDSGKYEDFIHNMVDKEIKSTMKYMQIMKEFGIDLSKIDESLMHMIYTGFFSSVLQIIEHDMDRGVAKRNVHQLKEFDMGGWERIWNAKFQEQKRDSSAIQ